MTKAEYDARLAAIDKAWAEARDEALAEAVKARDKADKVWTKAYDEACIARDKARNDLDAEFAMGEG